MEQTTQFIRQNSSILSTVAFLVVILIVLYVVYSYLYPADDPTYTQFLQGEADARQSIKLDKTKVPAIFTGGEFTMSFWIYIDDFNFRSSAYKLLFSISPMQGNGTINPNGVSTIVALLTPLKNSLMVRAATARTSNPSPGSATPASSYMPDINQESVLQNLLSQKTSMEMGSSTVDAPCDIKEVPLQRWVCVTIVSSGNILDVYMDGKLARSCVLNNVVQVPRSQLGLRLGEFGGRFSSVQMWGQQLTPDIIYGIYQMGPTQTKRSIFTDFAKYLNLNVSFTGSSPGQPIMSQADINPVQSLCDMGGSAYNKGIGGLGSAAYGAGKDAYNTGQELAGSLTNY